MKAASIWYSALIFLTAISVAYSAIKSNATAPNNRSKRYYYDYGYGYGNNYYYPSSYSTYSYYPSSSYGSYPYGGAYPGYYSGAGYLQPSWTSVAYMNPFPLGSGSMWSAGGGLVGNVLSFLIG